MSKKIIYIRALDTEVLKNAQNFKKYFKFRNCQKFY